MGIDQEEIVMAPISALNQLLYCAHRCYLMHVCGEMEDNVHIWRGRRLHRRSDRGEGGQVSTAAGTLRIARARPVASVRLGIMGVIDQVEFPPDGPPRVIEYKRGRAPTPRLDAEGGDGEAVGGREGAWPNDAVQVCAQVLCLEDELGVHCDEAFVYYEQSGGRRRVALDERLRNKTHKACARLVGILNRNEVPMPREGPQCEGCSLRGICIPRAYTRAAESTDPWEM